MSIELNKINRYPELQSIAGYNDLYNYLDTLQTTGAHHYPAYINTLAKQLRWRQKYEHFFSGPFPGRVIYYRPNTPIPALPPGPVGPLVAAGELNLIVCLIARFERACNDIVNNLHYTPTGINSFYKVVCSKYIAIPKMFVVEYLKKQVDYQIGQSYHKVQNAFVMAKTSNERWAMDLIDMRRYPNMYHMQYILNIVDYFSKKVMARPIRDRTAIEVRNAFQAICLQVNSYPHILVSDNGGEFRGALDVFINAHNLVAPPNQRINHIFTTTYSPTSNGLVERLNAELRRKLRMGCIRTTSRSWVPQLDNYVNSINMQVPSRGKFSPNQLFQAGYVPPANNLVNFYQKPKDTSTRDEKDNYVKANQIRRAARQMIKNTKRSPNYNFQVGDFVRVKLLALMTEMRRRKKNTFDEKYSAIKYSLFVFRIHSIVDATTFDNHKLPLPNIWDIRRYQYILETNTVPPVIVRNWVQRGAVIHYTTPKLFWGSDLIHVVDPVLQVDSHVPIDTARIVYINDL